MSLQRKSKNSSLPKISKRVAAQKCARVEACPRRRWLWQPTWAACCAFSARCKLPLLMLACAPCVCPPNSLLRPPAPPPRAAQAEALAALLLCEAARCAAVQDSYAAVRCGAPRCDAARRGAVRCGAARCGAVRRGAHCWGSCMVSALAPETAVRAAAAAAAAAARAPAAPPAAAAAACRATAAAVLWAPHTVLWGRCTSLGS